MWCMVARDREGKAWSVGYKRHRDGSDYIYWVSGYASYEEATAAAEAFIADSSAYAPARPGQPARPQDPSLPKRWTRNASGGAWHKSRRCHLMRARQEGDGWLVGYRRRVGGGRMRLRPLSRL